MIGLKRPVGLAALLLGGILAQAAPDRPNIVLILVDDLGYEALGSYGGVSYGTPQLDRLAASGVRITHAYATPLCAPSRLQLMTGRYTHRNYTEWGVLPKSEVTFANLLRDAGYATFVAGKWQLWGHTLLWDPEGPCCPQQGQTPAEAGFDEYLLWFLGTKGSRYADPVLAGTGRAAQTFEGAYGPDLLADFVVDAIESQAAERPEQPFFVYYSMVLVHAPFVPTPGSRGWEGDRHAADPENFADMVAHVDGIVGRILDTLEEQGIRDETLVLLTGDNGTPRGIVSELADGTRVPGEKSLSTDGGTRVPLLASWPGTIDAGRVSDALIDFTDFMPSLAEVAGGAVPDDREMDGRSFVPILTGTEESVREWVFMDFRPRFPGVPEATWIRDTRFKLYQDGRFFDIGSDVAEGTPLAEETLAGEALQAHADLQGAMAEVLED